MSKMFSFLIIVLHMEFDQLLDKNNIRVFEQNTDINKILLFGG